MSYTKKGNYNRERWKGHDFGDEISLTDETQYRSLQSVLESVLQGYGTGLGGPFAADDDEPANDVYEDIDNLDRVEAAAEMQALDQKKRAKPRKSEQKTKESSEAKPNETKEDEAKTEGS